MADGSLLRQLFGAYAKGDKAVFENAAEQLIQDERAKNHQLLATDLERILRNGRAIGRTQVLPDVPKDRERGFPLIQLAQFDHDWSRLVLPNQSMATLQQVVLENQKRDILAAAGVKPRQKLLFFGPPGCGKTLTAEVVSSVLAIPLATVKFDAVVSSFLGETAANLHRVFEFVERGRWVVLFDEFDAIGKDRDNPYEHGELKRVVNALLQLMDGFRGESVLIAATNHEGLLDSAVWRRFDDIIKFEAPSRQERIVLLGLFLRGFDSSSLDLVELGERLSGATGADIEWFALSMVRASVLDGRVRLSRRDAESASVALRHRLQSLPAEASKRQAIVQPKKPRRPPTG